MSPDACADLLDVSRETSERLAAYLDILSHWQQRINLVGKTTLDDPWRRHILDSGQLFRHLPERTRRLVDLGSGAGFPGLVLAIMGASEVHLVESDRRKAVFLREVVRLTGAPVTVHACRIESFVPMAADVITARALAPLDRLLRLTRPVLAPGTTCLFLKGKSIGSELTDAARHWHMKSTLETSLSHSAGVVLKLTEVSPVTGG